MSVLLPVKENVTILEQCAVVCKAHGAVYGEKGFIKSV
jgi:hypothetical protein